ncbi:hypothetical protein B0H13DRAFT_2648472 [Mycena leptocephala]|nr:hypothetical protein B0H13DRAFT_2648504 [Mycena leptocephala]KAJ7940130.1 hypothetical protein B0H13DRAFT_2648472 [Mycena leptocephala]
MGTQVSLNGRCLLSRISSNSRLNFFFQGLVPCSTLGMGFLFFSPTLFLLVVFIRWRSRCTFFCVCRYFSIPIFPWALTIDD